MRTQLLGLLACASLAGCVTVPVTNPDGSVDARLGQTVDVGGPRVTPLRIVSDSRCREGVDCVWAGQIKIEVRIDLGSRHEVKVLANDSPLPVADGELALVKVTPTPPARGEVVPGHYVFSLRFSGGV